MVSLRRKALLGLSGLAFAGVILANGYVSIGGARFGCADECVVTTYPGGGWMVRDSLGGACLARTHAPAVTRGLALPGR